MSFFPLYLDLTGKKILIVGGGKIALGKINVLLAFEPILVVVSPEGHEALQVLESHEQLIWHRKCYEESDLEGADLVIAATSNSEVNEQVFNDSNERHLLVNVVDDPAKCTFFFPAIVKRDDLVIGISSSGKYPALSKAIRRQIETQFPQIYGDLLEKLGAFREHIKLSVDDPKERKIILSRVVKELFLTEGELTLQKLESLMGPYDLARVDHEAEVRGKSDD